MPGKGFQTRCAEEIISFEKNSYQMFSWITLKLFVFLDSSKFIDKNDPYRLPIPIKANELQNSGFKKSYTASSCCIHALKNRVREVIVVPDHCGKHLLSRFLSSKGKQGGFSFINTLYFCLPRCVNFLIATKNSEYLCFLFISSVANTNLNRGGIILWNYIQNNICSTHQEIP